MSTACFVVCYSRSNKTKTLVELQCGSGGSGGIILQGAGCTVCMQARGSAKSTVFWGHNRPEIILLRALLQEMVRQNKTIPNLYQPPVHFYPLPHIRLGGGSTVPQRNNGLPGGGGGLGKYPGGFRKNWVFWLLMGVFLVYSGGVSFTFQGSFGIFWGVVL